MRKQLFGILATAGLGILLAGQTASAQVADQVVAHVPFQFVAGDAVLPAGTYTVRPDSSDPTMLWIINADGRPASAVLTEWGGPDNDGTQAMLQFKKYGEAYMLSSVALPGEAARQIPIPKKEVEADLVKVARIDYRAEHHGNG